MQVYFCKHGGKNTVRYVVELCMRCWCSLSLRRQEVWLHGCMNSALARHQTKHCTKSPAQEQIKIPNWLLNAATSWRWDNVSRAIIKWGASVQRAVVTLQGAHYRLLTSAANYDDGAWASCWHTGQPWVGMFSLLLHGLPPGDPVSSKKTFSEAVWHKQLTESPMCVSHSEPYKAMLLCTCANRSSTPQKSATPLISPAHALPTPTLARMQIYLHLN